MQIICYPATPTPTHLAHNWLYLRGFETISFNIHLGTLVAFMVMYKKHAEGSDFMQKHTDDSSSDQLTAYHLNEITRRSHKPGAKRSREADYSMPAGFFLDSFLKGFGVLFGFVQTPGYSSRK